MLQFVNVHNSDIGIIVHVLLCVAQRHTCCRCGKPFIIYNSGSYQSTEECCYHFKRLQKKKGTYYIVLLSVFLKQTYMFCIFQSMERELFHIIHVVKVTGDHLVVKLLRLVHALIMYIYVYALDK